MNSYLEAYEIIRNAGGTGAGNGPYVSFHDGFLPRSSWANFLPNADRIALDSHPYLCFNGQSSQPMSSYATTPCTTWGSAVNNSMAAFGLSTAGEFSNAVTDCGLFLNGVGLGTRYEGTYAGVWPRMGSCVDWTDWQNYSASTKRAIRQFALASMDALQVIHQNNDQHVFLLTRLFRITFSGHGRSVTPVSLVWWRRQLGLTNLDCRMIGCPRIQERPKASAVTPTLGLPLLSHGKPVELVQTKYLLQSLTVWLGPQQP